LLANANLTPTIGNLHVSRLTASQVVPTTNSPGSGLFILKRSPAGAGNDVSISLSLDNLSSPATAVHLHGPATATTNAPALVTLPSGEFTDRKSTRLNSSHSQISYAVFCLKKKIHAEA